jgi:hypothetical protein
MMAGDEASKADARPDNPSLLAKTIVFLAPAAWQTKYPGSPEAVAAKRLQLSRPAEDRDPTCSNAKASIRAITKR